jgi:hypothetical protein
MSTKHTVTDSVSDDVFVSGDWELVGEPYDRYETAYHAAALGPTWNGWATPLFTCEVAEKVIARQDALAKAAQSTDWDHFTWDGDVLVGTSDSYPDEEPTRDEGVLVDGVRLYTVGDGWCWQSTEDFPVVNKISE